MSNQIDIYNKKLSIHKQNNDQYKVSKYEHKLQAINQVGYGKQQRKKFLAFAGSLRKGSLNKKLIHEVADIAKQINADVTIIDLNDYMLPLFNEDIEKKGTPDNVKKLHELISSNDGLIIASPEYNGSMTGVLKNTIDWLSRDNHFFDNRKIAIMSCSPSSYGGSRGLKHLRDVLTIIRADVVKKQVTVPNAFKAFDEKGHIIDKSIKKQILQQISKL